MLGLEGCLPDRIDPDEVEPRLARIRQGLCLALAGTHVIDFEEKAHLFYFRRLLGAVQAGAHSNGMRFLAVDGQGGPLAEGIYYSIGGGFVVDGQGGKGTTPLRPPACRIRFAPAPTCWAPAAQAGCPSPRWCCAMSARARRCCCWSAMSACVERGCRMEGELQAPRARAAPPAARPVRGIAARSARHAGLGQPVRHGRQRRERRRRRGHRADQRRGRRDPGGAALLRALRAGRE